MVSLRFVLPVAVIVVNALVFKVVQGCSYVEEVFGPFIEAVVPIKEYVHDEKHDDDNPSQQERLILVKFMVMSTLENVATKYAVISLDGIDDDHDNEASGNGEDGSTSSFILDVIDPKNDTYIGFWQLEQLIDDDYLHSTHGITLLYPPPKELTLQEIPTEWGGTTAGGTLVLLEQEEGSHQSLQNPTSLLYNLTILEWPQAKIEIYSVASNGEETSLLASTMIELDKPELDDIDDEEDDREWYSNVEWSNIDDPSLVLSEFEKSFLSENIIYYYSPKLDRFYIHYLWPKLIHNPDCDGCEYSMADQRHMVSIYKFDSSSIVFPTADAAPTMLEIETVTTTIVKGMHCFMRWDVTVYDEVQVVRVEGCSNCHERYYLHYDTLSAALIGQEGINGQRDFQRSIVYYNDLSLEIASASASSLTYHRSSFDEYSDESICFEQYRHIFEENGVNYCAAYTPRNITIEECYLTNPSTCVRTIQLNDDELYDKLIPMSYWPPSGAMNVDETNNTANNNETSLSSSSFTPQFSTCYFPAMCTFTIATLSIVIA